jgi:uncharacterized protein YxjI
LYADAGHPEDKGEDAIPFWDTFKITDQNNQQAVECRGQTLSLSDRKEFADNAGKPLFSLRSKLISIHKSFYAEAPDGRILFEVKGKFSSKSKCLLTLGIDY